MFTYIAGTGSQLPSKCVSNDDLAKMMDTSDEWIRTRTGIRQRYYCDEGETTSTLATSAAQKALDAAKLSADDVDLIVLATSTPDFSFPSVASQVQANLGMTRGTGFDVQAVCSGFVYALNVADTLVKSGQFKNALVIGAEAFSKLLDFNDRTTAVLFGDGAGAVVIRSSDDPAMNGIIDHEIHSDGSKKEHLTATGGVATTQTAGNIHMNGREVFKHAVRAMAEIVPHMLAKNAIDKIDWLVPHQANSRIIESTAKSAGLPMDQVVMTVDQHANTSAASIPLALDVGVSDGRIQPGNVVLLEAFGAGFTWGASILRWVQK